MGEMGVIRSLCEWGLADTVCKLTRHAVSLQLYYAIFYL